MEAFEAFGIFDWVVVSVLLLLLHLATQWFYKLLREKKTFRETPYFHPSMVGMYVKFYGTVATQNIRELPFDRIKCAFHITTLSGVQSFKRKAPAKGYKEVKTVLESTSSEKVLLKNGEQRVYLGLHSKLHTPTTVIEVNKRSKTQKKPEAEHLENRKYKNYLYESYIIKGNEPLTVFGRLLRDGEDYIITDTYSERLPFMILSGDKLTRGRYGIGDYSLRIFLIVLLLSGLYAYIY